MATDNQLAKVAQQAKLTITAEFIPWSRSRSAVPNKASGQIRPLTDENKIYQADISARNLNWRVTLHHDGRPIWTGDYSEGIAYAPCYVRRQIGEPYRWRTDAVRDLDFEIEHGRSRSGIVKILPDTTRVLWSLLQDAQAIDYAVFEEWAVEYGYDPDSRKGEAAYQHCLQLGLALRASLGESGLTALQNAAQDY